jgi:hypothetical protein
MAGYDVDTEYYQLEPGLPTEWGFHEEDSSPLI